MLSIVNLGIPSTLSTESEPDVHTLNATMIIMVADAVKRTGLKIFSKSPKEFIRLISLIFIMYSIIMH